MSSLTTCLGLCYLSRPFQHSLIRVFHVCYSDRHFANSDLDNKHFTWEQNKKKCTKFKFINRTWEHNMESPHPQLKWYHHLQGHMWYSELNLSNQLGRITLYPFVYLVWQTPLEDVQGNWFLLLGRMMWWSCKPLSSSVQLLVATRLSLKVSFQIHFTSFSPFSDQWTFHTVSYSKVRKVHNNIEGHRL